MLILVLVFARQKDTPELTSAPLRPTATTVQKLETPLQKDNADGSHRPVGGTAMDMPSSSPSPLPPPDEWTTAEITESLKDCIRLVAPIHAEIEPELPMKHGACGLPAPVQLRALGEGPTRVEFHPPVTVSCRLVAGLYQWSETVLQPMAREVRFADYAHIRGHLLMSAHVP